MYILCIHIDIIYAIVIAYMHTPTYKLFYMPACMHTCKPSTPMHVSQNTVACVCMHASYMYCASMLHACYINHAHYMHTTPLHHTCLLCNMHLNCIRF